MKTIKGFYRGATQHTEDLTVCGCGKPSMPGRWHCEACSRRIAEDFDALCQTLRKGHRGAGGAAICICGAGCGGTSACSALSTLKAALTTQDERLRHSIMDAIGWSDW